MKKISFKMCDNFKISLLARNNVYELENNATILEIDCDVDEALTYKLHVLHKDEKNVLLMDKNESSISTMLTDAYFSEKGIYYIQIEGIKNDFRIVSNQIRLEVGAFINAEHIPTPEEQSIIDRLAIKVTTLENDVDLLKTDLEEEKKTRSDADEQFQNNIDEINRHLDITDEKMEEQFLGLKNVYVSHLINQNLNPMNKARARNNIDAASVEDIPKNTSELNNDSGFITGPVVRTVNGEAPDASGNVNVKGGGGEGTVKSVNNVLPDNNGNVSLPIPEAYDDTQVKADIAKNTSDIAGNTSDINAIKTNLIANTKRDDTLWNLNEDNTYKYQTKEETGINIAPSGAKYESLLDVRGNSIQDGEPSTDNPVEIHSVEELNFKVVTGKNLFDLNDFGNKYITVGSSIVGRYPVYVGVGKKVTLSTDYRRKNGFTSIFLLEREDDTATSSLGAYYEHPRTVTTVSDYVYVGLYFNATQEYQTTYQQLIEQGVNIQLEYGDSVTPYEPYREETHTITPPFQLNGIGDVYDCADIDNGIWIKKFKEITEDDYTHSIKNETSYFLLTTPTEIPISQVDLEYLKSLNNLDVGNNRVTITDQSGNSISYLMEYIVKLDSISDVQINGTSILENGVANIPFAKAEDFAGVIAPNTYYGFLVSNGRPLAQVYTTAQYDQRVNTCFLSKGTLDNLLTERVYTPIQDVEENIDSLIGEGSNVTIVNMTSPSGNMPETNSFINYGSATYSIANNVCTFKANTQYNGIRSYATFSITENHIYYLCARVKTTSNKIYLSHSATSFGGVYSTGSGEWEFISYRTVCPQTRTNPLTITDNGTTLTETQVKQVMLIDLTECYGAGNEPTKDYMDSVVSGANYWFDSIPEPHSKLGSVTKIIKPLSNKKVLVFGDSITETNNITSDGTITYWHTNWTSYAMDLLGANYTNLAQDGSSYHDWNCGDTYRTFKKQFDLAKSKSITPDVVIIALGTNDGQYTHSDSYDSVMAVSDINSLDRTNLYGAIRYAFWSVTNEYPSATVYVCLPIHRADADALYVREAIKKMIEYYGFKTIDGFVDSGLNTQNESWGTEGRWLRDGLHPNEYGKKIMAKNYARKIASTLPYDLND